MFVQIVVFVFVVYCDDLLFVCVWDVFEVVFDLEILVVLICEFGILCDVCCVDDGQFEVVIMLIYLGCLVMLQIVEDIVVVLQVVDLLLYWIEMVFVFVWMIDWIMQEVCDKLCVYGIVLLVGQCGSVVLWENVVCFVLWLVVVFICLCCGFVCIECFV